MPINVTLYVDLSKLLKRHGVCTATGRNLCMHMQNFIRMVASKLNLHIILASDIFIIVINFSKIILHEIQVQAKLLLRNYKYIYIYI